MKPITLDKNSWLYKLVCIFSNYESYYTPKNICDYGKAILGTICAIAFILVLSGILGIIPTSFLLCGTPEAACFKAYPVWQLLLSFLGTGIVTVAVIGSTILGIAILLDRRKERLADELEAKLEAMTEEEEREYWANKRKPKPPGALKLWYRSFKDKTCIPIEFK